MTSSSKPAKKDEDGDKSIRLLFLRLPPWHTWRSSSNSSVNAQLLDVQPGARVTQNELPNQGLEALVYWAAQRKSELTPPGARVEENDEKRSSKRLYPSLP